MRKPNRHTRRPLAALALLAFAAPLLAQSTTGLIPLIDLGAATYQGFQGGLYPGSVNTPPSAHAAAALRMAQQVVPRDALGNPDPAGGKIVFIAIGMSNTAHEFAVFERQEDLNTDRNARVVIIDTALGGQAARDIVPPNAPYWTVVNDRLTALRVTDQQVQVAWLKQAERRPPNNFPTHARELRDDLIAIAQNLHDKFPNLRLCYVSSRIYAGYATTSLNPEPQAYESGFSVKWLIEDQINADPELNFDPNAGAVRAPLLLWGPYMWADGVNPRSDGLVWLREDFEGDGTHPAPSGEQKVADLLSAFFAEQPSARLWWPARPGARLVAIDADADAYVRADAPRTNFGSAPELLAAAGTQPINTFLRFDGSAVHRPVLSAKLSLRIISSGGGPVALVPDTSWNEPGITFNNAPSIQPGALALMPRASRDGSFGADVTDAFNADPDRITSFAITSTNSQPRRYRSRESGQPPRLILAVSESVPGDLTGDGCVDLTDLGILLGDFGCAPPASCPGDVDGDGNTDLTDLGILLADFGCAP